MVFLTFTVILPETVNIPFGVKIFNLVTFTIYGKGCRIFVCFQSPRSQKPGAGSQNQTKEILKIPTKGIDI